MNKIYKYSCNLWCACHMPQLEYENWLPRAIITSSMSEITINEIISGMLPLEWDSAFCSTCTAWVVSIGALAGGHFSIIYMDKWKMNTTLSGMSGMGWDGREWDGLTHRWQGRTRGWRGEGGWHQGLVGGGWVPQVEGWWWGVRFTCPMPEDKCWGGWGGMRESTECILLQSFT